MPPPSRARSLRAPHTSRTWPRGESAIRRAWRRPFGSMGAHGRVALRDPPVRRSRGEGRRRGHKGILAHQGESHVIVLEIPRVGTGGIAVAPVAVGERDLIALDEDSAGSKPVRSLDGISVPIERQKQRFAQQVFAVMFLRAQVGGSRREEPTQKATLRTARPRRRPCPHRLVPSRCQWRRCRHPRRRRRGTGRRPQSARSCHGAIQGIPTLAP